MSERKPRLTSIRNVYVPCFPDKNAESAAALGAAIDAELRLVGVIYVRDAADLAAQRAAAEGYRKKLEETARRYGATVCETIVVSGDPWQDLQKLLVRERADLLCLDWPEDAALLHADLHQILSCPPCNVALVRGKVKRPLERVLVPIRGGPHAELALRVTLSLEPRKVDAFHFLSTSPESDLAFKGLSLVLPQLPGVTPRYETSDRPAERILSEAASADVIIMGCSSQPVSAGVCLGPVADQVLKESEVPVVLVRSAVETPAGFYGNEMVGYDAISLLVNHWFAENTFKGEEFADLAELVRRKQQSRQTISLVIPALNEEETIGPIIRNMRQSLQHDYPLLDEIILIDSHSSDRTREIAKEAGIPVYIHQEMLPELGARKGKGDALWKSLLAARGDIIVWIDADVSEASPRLVYGLVGPLLRDSRIQYVKGYSPRLIDQSDGAPSEGGGRLTELTARPLLNLFYPELSGVVQPLAGECAGRRALLESVPFYSGPGVEMGLLLDIFEKAGLNSIGQVDIYQQAHRDHAVPGLSRKAFAVIQVIINKLEQRYGRSFLDYVNRSMKLIRHADDGYSLEVVESVESLRPPMLEIPAYQKAFERK